MFNFAVFQLTLGRVAMLFCFIAVGYFLRRSGKVGQPSAYVLSIFTTFVFTPAYIISNLSKSFTVANFAQNAKPLLVSVVFLTFVLLLSKTLATILARSNFEKRSLTYIFAFANTGYFGYPVIEAVFGKEALAQYIVFCLPILIVIYSYGYALFASDSGINWKRTLLSPMLIGTLVGIALGLSGLGNILPSFFSEAMAAAANCMSPCAMLLAGVVLGAFPLKKLLSGFKPYWISLIRLIGIVTLFAVPIYFLGIQGAPVFLGLATLCLPVGLNCVVYPENFGHGAPENAKICFVSMLLSIVTLPVVFAVLPWLTGNPF